MYIPDSFDEQMREAVKVVLSAFPSKTVDRDTVVSNAMVWVTVSARRVEAKKLIVRLVECSPRCYGAYRTKSFWKIVRMFLRDEESVQAYLQQFPKSLTSGQWYSVAKYLINDVGFSMVYVSMVMHDRFDIRAAYPRDSRIRRCHFQRDCGTFVRLTTLTK